MDAAPTASGETKVAVRMEAPQRAAGAGAAAVTNAAAGSGAAHTARGSAGSGGVAGGTLEPSAAGAAGGTPEPSAAGATGRMPAAPAAGSGATSAAPTLTQIYEMVYTMKCAACHSMAPSDNQNGKLGMLRSKDQLYDALVNKPAQGAMCMGKGTYVVPGKPEMSLLIQKLSAKPPCGVTMPLGGTLEPMLIEKLSAWISAGALNN